MTATFKRLSALATLLIFLWSPMLVAWNPFETGCNTGDGSANNSVTCVTSKQAQNPLTGPNSVIARVTNLLATIAGIAAVIAIIVGGIRFITASGDPNGINAAKNTILYAVIGLVVVVFTRTLVVYVVRRF